MWRKTADSWGRKGERMSSYYPAWVLMEHSGLMWWWWWVHLSTPECVLANRNIRPACVACVKPVYSNELRPNVYMRHISTGVYVTERLIYRFSSGTRWQDFCHAWVHIDTAACKDNGSAISLRINSGLESFVFVVNLSSLTSQILWFKS